MSILKCLSRITAELKYETVYECCLCGEEEIGVQATKIVRATGPELLIAALREVPQHADHAPFGWGHQEDGYHCPACIQTQKEST